MANPKPTLIEMPELVMRKILKDCDFVAVQSLRKTCRDLHTIIEDSPSFFPQIVNFSVCVSLDRVDLFIHIKELLYYPAGSMIILTYKKEGTGTQLTWKRSDGVRKKFLKNSDYMDLFQIDLGFSLAIFEKIAQIKIDLKHQHPRQLTRIAEHRFGIFNHKEAEHAQFGQFLDILNEKLKNRSKKIQPNNLIFSVSDQNGVLKILPLLEPGTLEIIIFNEVNDYTTDSKHLEINEILGLEQWRKAKEISITKMIISEPITSFGHFERGRVTLDMVSVVDVEFMKENFIANPALKFFSIELVQGDITPLLTVLYGNPPAQVEADERVVLKWFFRTPDENSFVTISHFYVFLQFQRVERSKVPDYVLRKI